MAEHLVSIHGTEKDKINCPFYYKIGACRHGDRCSRIHNKPLFSQTILVENLYQSPDQIVASAAAQGLPPPSIPEEDIRHHFDDFYHDVFEEMSRYGHVEQLHVCENLADHLAGNTYVKFRNEESAQAALTGVQGRYYAGRLVKVEFSPVTDFREGKCRPFERFGQCERGDYCHFMHLRKHPGVAAMNNENSLLESKRPEHKSYRSSRDRSDNKYRDRGEVRQSSPRESARYREERDSEKDSRYGLGGKRSRDRGRERGYHKDRRDSFERDRSRDRYRGRDRDRDRGRNRGGERDRHDQDKDHGHDHDRDRGYHRDHKRGRDRDYLRDYERDRERDRYEYR